MDVAAHGGFYNGAVGSIADGLPHGDLIPGFEISEKISRMELIVQRIFERAASHPEIIPDLKKMMDYYLPMTVHEDRYKALYDNIVNGKVFERDEAVTWECLNCGYRVENGKALEKCPVCAHPQSFFALETKNY